MKSLIIHEENTKEIMSVKEFVYLIQNILDLLSGGRGLVGGGGGGCEASRFYRQKWTWPSTDISVAYHKQLRMREMKRRPQVLRATGFSVLLLSCVFTLFK